MKTCPRCGAECPDTAANCSQCDYRFVLGDDLTPAADDLWAGRVIGGRFVIQKRLGGGGMGEVFLAEQRNMNRPVALKCLRPELASDEHQVERFKREAQAASQLKHPNTIIVHDFGQDDDGTLYIAMEYLEGHTLADLLEQRGSLQPGRIAHIMSQVCGSLEEAHERGVIHRDLKPENIFLTRRGANHDYVKVLDFGIAKVTQTGSGDALSTLTQTGAVFGTPQYMSPEQIKGQPLDPRSDVYALGVLLYQMASGALPFQAETAIEMLTKHLSEQPRPITSPDSRMTHGGLSAVAMRALAKDPQERYPDIPAFVEGLDDAVPEANIRGQSGLSPALTTHTPNVPHAAQAAPPVGTGGRDGRSGLAVALVLAGVAALAIAGWFAMQNRGDSLGGDAGATAAIGGADSGDTTPASAAGGGGAVAAAGGGGAAAAAGGGGAVAAAGGGGAVAAGGSGGADAAGGHDGADAAGGHGGADAAGGHGGADAAGGHGGADAAGGHGGAAPRDPIRPTARGPAIINVRSNPSGAKVYVDGRYRGKTPLLGMKVSAGKHRVEVRHNGRRYSKTLRVRSGSRSNIRARL